MKKLLLIIAFVCVSGLSAFAQRFAYVDSEYILKHIPEYNSAQKQLDALSQQWQKQVDDRLAEVEKLFKAYQADQVMLTPDMRKRREEEIVEKEKAAKEFQRQKFGFEGELYQQRIKLIKPIQERVARAVEAVAESNQLDMILDKNSQVILLYASSRLDKSNEVITRLGYKPGTVAQ
ncbi:periplasmic chaperone for outer membrane proteins Skp [Arcticibacter tournemirensis]|uniref:OmpH family outer membrane protein n=1 Tax=Arcticibacter tournemirensis TaxID=699437 RepID=A0A4Q0M2R6_9SPHI|nr:OmpH family outer membrane protein [Arcticibacter tournemirensis]KAA8475885.1 OmpH family outer membrane protein [Arcticibacter tournemirensis]RXF67003.1 OmpH family outer membrane protein [Arcticibacter tournemirensis]TQM51518.1 periplasmic chaperone for outer membrane proteins Skp [Arcticibacter tournemirensis]